MTTDWLWDGEGEDAELESLAMVMAPLRYDADPPALPRTPLRVVRPSPPLPKVAVPRHRGSPWKHAQVMPLLLAAGLMLMGFGVAWVSLAKERSEARRGWNLVPVVVASMDLSEGTIVTMEQLSQRSVPEQFVTASVVKPDSANYVVGQKLQAAVAAGDPLLWSQFETNRAMERLASRIMKKARAIALDVQGVAAVGGFVQSNDHIDVIGSFKDPATNQQVAVTLMQNVVVLTGNEKQSLTVLVLPEEAEVLVLAGELGNLTLTLRNEDDLDVFEERGRATFNTLLSGERAKVLQQKRFNTIQVIRGSTTVKSP